MDAVKKTYSKTTDRTYAWYQQSEKIKNNNLDLLDLLKDQFIRKEDPNFGEGCYLHVLERRSTNRRQDDEDETNKKITAIDDKIKNIEIKMDAILKALNVNGKNDDSLNASKTNGKK